MAAILFPPATDGPTGRPAMVPITEPVELVDLTPSGKAGADGVVIPLRSRAPQASADPGLRPRRREPAEHLE
ncbi:hypothetical protein Q0Z83_016580 [Actinoplanes sichuanensis]|nr:hypothetical protein Q0Z83_016580 [Actinoplanes sichuanensis]